MGQQTSTQKSKTEKQMPSRGHTTTQLPRHTICVLPSSMQVLGSAPALPRSGHARLFGRRPCCLPGHQPMAFRTLLVSLLPDIHLLPRARAGHETPLLRFLNECHTGQRHMGSSKKHPVPTPLATPYDQNTLCRKMTATAKICCVPVAEEATKTAYHGHSPRPRRVSGAVKNSKTAAL